jgi:hypothetical protein
MICLLFSWPVTDLTIYYVDNEHNDEFCFFRSQRMATSVCTEDVDCTDNAQHIFWQENEECLLFTIGWSGRLLFLFFSHTGDVALL